MERFGGGHETPEFRPAFEVEPKTKPETAPNHELAPEHNKLERRLGHLGLSGARQHDLAQPPAERPAAPDVSSKLDYEPLKRSSDARLAPKDHAMTAFVDDSSGSSGSQDDGAFRLLQKIGLAPADVTARDYTKRIIAEKRIGALNDYPDVQIGGRPLEAVKVWNRQDHNHVGPKNTCGLENTREMAALQGVERTPDEHVQSAIDQGLCKTDGEDKAQWGGTTRDQQIALLKSLGLDAYKLDDMGVEDVAALVDKGYGVAVDVDAHEMIERYDKLPERLRSASEAHPHPHRHSLYITGTVKFEGKLVGFIANDPTWKPGVMIDIDDLRTCWEQQGGRMVWTRTRPKNAP
ncbi:hypothetical protein Lesp01_11840 [Lentzea sp. NBRC 102530]|nr:hypothetical protein Lesp01_11840 [Lentzea sp. NBRC 102530]